VLLNFPFRSATVARFSGDISRNRGLRSMSICTRCGLEFGCAMADGASEPCWCTRLPAVVPLPAGAAGCWCPACLERHIAEQAAAAPKPAAD
jgi:hypothetical protein